MQKQALDKEEEQQLELVERENELIRDLEQAQAYADKTEAELQTRERQLKQMREKLEDDDKRVSDAQARVEVVVQERHEALAQQRECQTAMEQL